MINFGINIERIKKVGEPSGEVKPWPFENKTGAMGVNHQFGDFKVASMSVSGSLTPDGNDFD